jgi:hypothetical protein
MICISIDQCSPCGLVGYTDRPTGRARKPSRTSIGTAELFVAVGGLVARTPVQRQISADPIRGNDVASPRSLAAAPAGGLSLTTTRR